jgi:EF hand
MANSKSLSGRARMLLALLWTFPLLGGCGKLAVTKLQKYDPATAATKAIETYDKNGDGKLSADELKATPGLVASGRRLDSNGDKIVTREELQARFQSLDAQADYIGLDVRVVYKGKPLANAEVTFSPEQFLGDGFPRFSGTTNEGGGCPLTPDGKQLPGIPTGYYQVKIVSAKQGIDAIRGVEIADDTTGNRLEIAL